MFNKRADPLAAAKIQISEQAQKAELLLIQLQEAQTLLSEAKEEEEVRSYPELVDELQCFIQLEKDHKAIKWTLASPLAEQAMCAKGLGSIYKKLVFIQDLNVISASHMVTTLKYRISCMDTLTLDEDRQAVFQEVQIQLEENPVEDWKCSRLINMVMSSLC